MSTNMIANPATPKQESYINSLIRKCANLDALTAEQHDILEAVKAARTIEKEAASYLIGGLLKCEEKPRGQMAAPGYYIHQNGTYLVVVQNKKGNATYAKMLDVTKEKGQRAKARWVYAPGLGTEVAHMEPMTIEQAANWGHLHGVCIKCCKPLTDPVSVKNGIGPVCAKSFR